MRVLINQWPARKLEQRVGRLLRKAKRTGRIHGRTLNQVLFYVGLLAIKSPDWPRR